MVPVEAVRDGVRVAQQLGQHDGVFYGHRPAFGHVGGVAWAASPIRTTRAGMPAAQFDPFDRREMDLVVALQGGEVGRDRLAEALEALPEPFQAARRRIVEAFPAQPANP